MAELLGLAASISTLAGVAIMYGKAAKHLYSIAAKSDKINESIKFEASSLSVSGSALRIAYKQLKHGEFHNPDSAVFLQLQRDGVLATLEERSSHLRSRLRMITALEDSLTSRVRFVSAVKWLLFQQAELRPLLTLMESFKTSITIIISVAQLEVNQVDAKHADPLHMKRLMQDNEALKASLKVYEVVMKEHQQQLLANSNDALGHGPFVESTETFFGPIESLLGLSRNMRRNGTVHLDPSHGFGPKNEPTSPTSPPTPLSSHKERVLRHPLRQRNSVQTPLQSDERDQDRSRPAPTSISVTRKAEKPKHTIQPRVSHRGLAPTAHATTELNTTALPYTINPTNFKAVSLHFVVNNIPERLRQVTGVIDVDLGISLISHRTAFGLHLELVSVSKNDPSTINFVSGDPPVKVTSKTSAFVLRRAGLGRAKGSTITFLVVENLGHNMIIGG